MNPDNKLRLSLTYPASVGRNMAEIVRCVQALQLSHEKSVATPANWPENHARIPDKNGCMTSKYKGSVFLLPSVSKEDAEAYYPGYLTCQVPSKREYLRLVKRSKVDTSNPSIEEEKASMMVKTAWLDKKTWFLWLRRKVAKPVA